jgi:hypothetical protein
MNLQIAGSRTRVLTAFVELNDQLRATLTGGKIMLTNGVVAQVILSAPTIPKGEST